MRKHRAAYGQRIARDKCWIVVRGQTVGDVQLVPPPAVPADPEYFRYRAEFYGAANEPCFLRCRGQVRLAIADRLWNDGLMPEAIPAAIGAEQADIASACG